MDGISSDFFRDFPAMPPPPGVESNFDNPPSLALDIIVVNAVFLSLMAIAVGIRLYVRVLIANAPGWDDCELVAKQLDMKLMLTKMHVSELLYVRSFAMLKSYIDRSGYSCALSPIRRS